MNLKGARNARDCCSDILQCPVIVLIFPCLVNIDIGLLVNTVSKCRAHMIEHEVVIRFHRTIHLLFYTQRVRETRGTVAETCYAVLLDDSYFHLIIWRLKKTVLSAQELILSAMVPPTDTEVLYEVPELWRAAHGHVQSSCSLNLDPQDRHGK